LREAGWGDEKEGYLFSHLPQPSTAQLLFNELFTRPRATVDTLYLLTRAYYPRNDDLNDCLLRTVRVYKRGFIIQHESVVFTLQSASGTEFHLLVDRNLDFTSVLSCSLSSGSSFTDGSWKPALDYARLIQTEDPPRQLYGERVRTITLPNPPDRFQVNLLQLAVLLFTIGDTNDGPKYHLTKMNCFWFARMVCEAIWRLARNAQAGDSVMEEFHGNEGRMGKCLWIRLDGSGPQDGIRLGELIDRYHQTYTNCRASANAQASHDYSN
jgi:hypothetical protein